MTSPTPYLFLPGTTRDALTFYGEVFGCSVGLRTLAEFGRTDGPADAIAHGYLTDGPVTAPLDRSGAAATRRGVVR